MKKLFVVSICVIMGLSSGCRKQAVSVPEPEDVPSSPPVDIAKAPPTVTPPPVESTGPKGIGIASCKVAVSRKAIAGVPADVSGVTYSGKTKTLFAVRNKNCIVIEMDLKGNMKRKLGLTGFDDTEGNAWLGGDRFAVVEERRRKLVIVEIGPETQEVIYDNCLKYKIEEPGKNDGIEGVAFDSAKQRLFIVKEKEPRKIFQLDLSSDPSATPTISEPWDLEKDSLYMSDVAGVYYDGRSGNLLIVSDESKCLVECTTSGKEVSRMSLKSGKTGLDHDVMQPEGVTMDEQGNVYIVGEPNHFYSFRPHSE